MHGGKHEDVTGRTVSFDLIVFVSALVGFVDESCEV